MDVVGNIREAIRPRKEGRKEGSLARAVLLLLTVIATSMASGQYIPPDIFADEHRGADVLRRNMGQVLGTDGEPRQDVAAYFEHVPLGIYLRDSSRVSFTYHVLHTDSVTPDTIYRVDMAVGAAKLTSPELVLPTPDVSNYYYGKHTAEQVPAYHRGIYKEVFDHIDLHLYGSTGGPRLAYVVKPGGDPGQIKLLFTGQDSLGIDWQGALKIYMQGKWIELKQALAYQVDGNGNTIGVNWTAAYELGQDNAVVHFSFDTYNQQWPLVLQIGYAPFMLGGTDDRDMNWSTYMGGSQDEEFTCVETDEEGNPYACGHSLSLNFPVDPGNEHYPPFQPEAAGHDNAIVVKFKGENKRLEWATYYGGHVKAPSDLNGMPYARTEARKLAVYKDNEAGLEHVFVTGATNCTDFSVIAKESTPFEGGSSEVYSGGSVRMWVGAFRKEDGIRDWATTHGQTGAYNGQEFGLAIVVDHAGRVAVGGRVHRTVDGVMAPPDFPLVTPSGAYGHAGGGGFVLSFNPDFTLRWATTVGSYNNQAAYTQVTDLRYAKSGKFLWFTGANCGSMPATDLVPPLGGGYFSNNGTVILGTFDMEGATLDYCTRWGGGGNTQPLSIAYGLDVDPYDKIWVVGGTRVVELSNADAPMPGGASTIHHSAVNAGGAGNPCDGFILKLDAFNHELEYGTLIGGDKYDMLLDVGHDGNNVYITGETRSTSGFAADLDPERYFQPLNANGNRRDAVVLGIRAGNSPPEMLWRTAYGGTASERGWGIASSELPLAEVYLAGATSSQAYQAFPLHEFSTTSTLDFYQNTLQGGAGASGSLIGWYRFEWGLNFENGGLGYASTENLHQGTDAFIASFAGHVPVGVGETTGAGQTLQAIPRPNGTSWQLGFPHAGQWTVQVYDPTGRLVRTLRVTGNTTDLDLAGQAQGLYLLKAREARGAAASTKLVKP